MKILMRVLKVFIILAIVVGVSVPVYAKQNPQNGTQKICKKDSAMCVENRFKDGKLTRKRSYYKTGKVYKDYKYKNGVTVTKRSYHKNGKVKSSWVRIKGETRYYNPDGTLRAILKQDKLQPIFPSSQKSAEQPKK